MFIASAPSIAPTFSPTLTPQSDGDYTITEFSALLQSAAIDVATVLSSTHPNAGSTQVKAVIAVIVCWLVILVTGLIVFSRWDRLDRLVLTYAPMKSSKTRKTFTDLNELSKKRDCIDNAFLEGKILTMEQIVDNDDSEFYRRDWFHKIVRTFLSVACGLFSSREYRDHVSLLYGGNLIPRYLRALQSYHPYLWFFSNRSLQKTRVMRFLATCKAILLTIFISTVFFDVYFPSSSLCSVHTSAASCLQVPSKILSGHSECSWDAASLTCSVLPPPESASFVIAVAILTFILVSPFDLFFYWILNGVCSRRPMLELIGLNSFDILGGEAASTSACGRDASKGHITRDEDSQITAILAAFRHFQHRWKRNHCSNEEIDQMTKIAGRIGLAFSEDKELTLQYIASLQSGDNIRACIGAHVRRSKSAAATILRNMNRLDDESSKSSYLLQCYVIEHFDFLSQLSLKRGFMHFSLELPASIHPGLWLMGWTSVIACILFFIVWILQWGLQADVGAVSSWGVNLALNILAEIFLTSLIRIFFINVLVIELSRPVLLKIYSQLRALDNEMEVSKIESEGSAIEQYLKPSLLAANDPSVSGFRATKFLQRISAPLELNGRKSYFGSILTRQSIDDVDRTEV